MTICDVCSLVCEPALEQYAASTQRAAVSAHWSAELRAKVAAAKATERNRVTITHEED